VGVRVQKVRANIVGGPTHVDTDTKSPMDHQSGQQKAFGNGNGGSYKTRTRSLSLFPHQCVLLSLFAASSTFFFFFTSHRIQPTGNYCKIDNERARRGDSKGCECKGDGL